MLKKLTRYTQSRKIHPMLKGMAVVFAALIFAALIRVSADAETLTYGDFSYQVSNSTVSITKYNGSDASVTIPAAIDGYPVTGIGEYAFKGCKNLVHVDLPASLTTIGNWAFYETAITDITIPSALTTSGAAFKNCAKLKTVSFASGTTKIPGSLFYGCSGLEKISIPEGVTEIGSSAFAGCSNLVTVTLPSSLTAIGTEAFQYCTKLDTVALPGNLKTIGNSAFRGCTSLAGVDLPASLTYLGSSVFTGTAITDITIPSALTESGTAFSGCTKLKTVSFASGTTKIPGSLFYGCSGLEKISIPEGVTEIGSSAFSGCSNLTAVELPSSLTKIPGYLFYGCSKIKEISIPEGVTEIGDYAFYKCSNLVTAALPSSVTTFGAYAFYGCTNLVTAALPSGLKTIGAHAFEGCTKLDTVVLPGSLKTIGKSAFYECKNLTHVDLPASLTTIEKYAFYGTAITDITIPKSLTTSDAAFKNCAKLKTVSFASGATKIPGSLFYGCSGLEKISIPEGITEIGYDAFRDCANLAAVDLPSSLTTIKGNNVFAGCSKNLVLTGMAGSCAETYAKNNGITFKGKTVEKKASAVTLTLSKTVYSYTGSSVSLSKKAAVTGSTGTITYTYYTDSACTKKTGTSSSAGSAAKAGAAPKAVGTYYVKATVAADSAYKSATSAAVKFKISTSLTSKTTVTLSKTAYTYTGSACKPTVTVKYNSKKLTSGTDYTVSYKNNKNAGTATVTVTGCGKYMGSVSKTFTISKASSSVSLSSKTAAYNGSAISMTGATVKGSTGKVTYTYYRDFSCKTKTGTTAASGGASKAGAAPKKVGTYYVKATVAADSNYASAVSSAAKLKITTSSVSSAKVTLSSQSYTYTGSARKPAVTVTKSGVTLKAGTDYTVTYSDNVNAGTATVKIEGKGGYTGSKKVTFTIKKLDISAAKITLEKSGYSSQGSTVKPKVLSVKVGSVTLKTADYKVTYTENVYAGIYRVVVKGIGSCTGSASVVYKTSPVSLASAKVTLKATAYTYDGKAKTPGVTVSLGGEVLVKNTDYTVSYSNNTNAGTATVKITAKGHYRDSVSARFTINKATPTITLASKDARYTGQAISIDAATTNSTGKVSYTYYKDYACTKKTTTADGAAKTGGAPANNGTYYVKAHVGASTNYTAADSAAATLRITNTYKNDLPAWCLEHNDFMIDGQYNENYEYIAREGSSVRIATNNIDGTIACTMFTLHKLRLRGLGFPFKSSGINLNGAGWYDGCIDSWTENGITHTIVKKAGKDALENLWQEYGSKYDYLSNIVVSYASNPAKDSATQKCGHVMLIDKLYADADSGEIMVQYSDNGSLYDMNTFMSGDYSGITQTKTLKAYKQEYKQWNGDITGVVLIGE